jgi:hypothetical protein
VKVQLKFAPGSKRAQPVQIHFIPKVHNAAHSLQPAAFLVSLRAKKNPTRTNRMGFAQLTFTGL